MRVSHGSSAVATAPFVALILELYPWMPAAMKLLECCRQSETWTTREGQTLNVSEMATSHVANLIRWLEKREEALLEAARVEAEIYAAEHNGGEWAQDSLEQAVMELQGIDAHEFLTELPLYVALRKRLTT